MKRAAEVPACQGQVGGFRKTRFRGREQTELAAYLVGAAYNLIRIGKLMQALCTCIRA